MNIADLPIVTEPVSLNDLPGLLGPYAVQAPVFVYLRSDGNLSATRLRKAQSEEDDLILILAPRPAVPKSYAVSESL